jgi:23S rRNA pseudouridine1911/1915/1917 synthase
MKILFEDNHLLVVEKPINIPMQEDSSKDVDLLTLGKQYLKEKYQKPGNVYLGLVHRLDRPVGGVVVFAKTSKAAARLSESIRTDQMLKTYEAIVEGPLPSQSTLIDYLTKDEKTNTSSVTDKTQGKYCELDWSVLRSTGDLHYLRIALKTGRSHQIRVQFASRNCPLYGDQRYNPLAKPGQQIALWAVSLAFPHPVLKTMVEFTSLAPFSDLIKI